MTFTTFDPVGWALPTNSVGKARPTFAHAALNGLRFVYAGISTCILRPDVQSHSHRKHRDAEVWQRRFWEHTVRDEDDFNRLLDYIHFNPVKHGHVACPHLWKHSSFRTWAYCNCVGPKVKGVSGNQRKSTGPFRSWDIGVYTANESACRAEF